MDILLIKATLLFYLLGNIFFWVYLSKRSEKWFSYSLFLAGAGLLFHTCSIVFRTIEGGYFPMSKLYESTSFFSWALVVSFLVLGYKYRIHALGSFVLPLVLITLSAAMLLPKTITPLDPVLQSNWFAVHTILSVMGFVCFAVAFSTGLMYLVQDRLLKEKRFSTLFHKLPSLGLLDEINQKAVAVGFPLLTLGMMSGFLWAKAVWGSIWSNDPKMLFAVFTWMFYLLVLHGRYSVGWRSKKAAYLSVIGFLCALSFFILVTILSTTGMHAFL